MSGLQLGLKYRVKGVRGRTYFKNLVAADFAPTDNRLEPIFMVQPGNSFSGDEIGSKDTRIR
jgi:hypothetical protein